MRLFAETGGEAIVDFALQPLDPEPLAAASPAGCLRDARALLGRLVAASPTYKEASP